MNDTDGLAVSLVNVASLLEKNYAFLSGKLCHIFVAILCLCYILIIIFVYGYFYNMGHKTNSFIWIANIYLCSLLAHVLFNLYIDYCRNSLLLVKWFYTSTFLHFAYMLLKISKYYSVYRFDCKHVWSGKVFNMNCNWISESIS